MIEVYQFLARLEERTLDQRVKAVQIEMRVMELETMVDQFQTQQKQTQAHAYHMARLTERSCERMVNRKVTALDQYYTYLLRLDASTQTCNADAVAKEGVMSSGIAFVSSRTHINDHVMDQTDTVNQPPPVDVESDQDIDQLAGKITAELRFVSEPYGVHKGSTVYEPTPLEIQSDAWSSNSDVRDGWVKLVADHPIKRRSYGFGASLVKRRAKTADTETVDRDQSVSKANDDSKSSESSGETKGKWKLEPFKVQSAMPYVHTVDTDEEAELRKRGSSTPLSSVCKDSSPDERIWQHLSYTDQKAMQVAMCRSRQTFQMELGHQANCESGGPCSEACHLCNPEDDDF